MVLLLSFLCSIPGPAKADDEISLATAAPIATPDAQASPKSLPADGAGESTAEPQNGATADPSQNTVYYADADGSTKIILTAGGDFTIGGDVRKKGISIFDKELKRQNGDMSFITRNVKDILSQDDISLVNFEMTLTTAPVFKKQNDFCFSAPLDYVQFLNNGSIEAVSLENNHVMDHGQEGIDETRSVLDKAGIVWSSTNFPGVYKVKGVSIAMLSYQTFNGKYPELTERVPQDIADAKAKYDIVIVSYHWGEELDYVPNSKQIKLGRLTIDSGADLVLGHHSHRINPIEYYKDKYIVYSLGNFCFAGNEKPKDMSTFLFQIRFAVKDGETKTEAIRIIPSRISSKTDYNDFIPTPFSDQRLIDNVINMLKNNGKKLQYALENYPTDWE